MLTSALPIVIIGGLLYAGFFVKPQAKGISVAPPVIEKRDRFYGLANPSEGVVWAAGNLGKVLLSSDAGKSWSPQATGVDAHLQSVAAWDTKRAVAVGNGGTVIITADGGATWEKVVLPDSVQGNKLLRVRVADGGRAWAVGEMGTVLSTTDFGVAWNSVGSGEDVAWNDVYFVGDSGWLVGEFGRMRVTRDGGTTWKPLEAPVQSSLSALCFRNERDGVAVGTQGAIIRTSDGGATWHTLPSVTEEHLYDVVWDTDRWMVVGDKGTLLGVDLSGKSVDLSAAIDDSAWHMQILRVGDRRYMLAGPSLRTIDVGVAN